MMRRNTGKKLLSFILTLVMLLALMHGSMLSALASEYSYNPSVNTATVDAYGNVTVTITIRCSGIVYGYGLCLFASEPELTTGNKLANSGELHFNSDECKHVFYQPAENGGDSNESSHNVTLTFNSNSKDIVGRAPANFQNRYAQGSPEDKTLYERLSEGNSGNPWHIVIGTAHDWNGGETNCDYYLGTTQAVFGTLPEAKNGNKTYSSFAEAFSAAKSGDCIEFLSDVTINSGITLPDGITLKGNGHSITYAGGPVFSVANGALATVTDLTIKDSGQALIVPTGSTVILKNSTITGCQSGLYAAVQLNGTLLLDGTTIQNNTSTEGRSGGVIELGNGATLYGINSAIVNNTAQSHTGGINNYKGSVYLMRCRITGNTSTGSSYASSLGGGVRTGENFYAANSVITGNKSGPGAGDTLDIGGAPTLKNCIYGSVSDSKNISGGSSGNDVDAAIPSNTTEYSYDIIDGKLHVTMKYDDNGQMKSLLPLEDPKITQAPSTDPEGLDYTGEPVSLVNAGTVSGGTFVYAVSTSTDIKPAEGDYSEDIPTATEVGTYYVWYKVRGDEYHNDSAATYITVNIVKRYTELTEKTKPTVSGANNPPQVGDTLTAFTPATGVSYLWFRCKKTDNGMSYERIWDDEAGTVSHTGNTYTLSSEDYGYQILAVAYQYQDENGDELSERREVKAELTAPVTAPFLAGDKGYGTLQAAIDAAESGDTITMVTDYAGDLTIPAGKELTLDLNGKTLTGNIDVELNGTLDIEDSSEGETGVVTGTLTSRGATFIHGGTFEGNVDNYGAVYIFGGTFKGTVTNREAGENNWNAVAIKDGKFSKRPVAESEDFYIIGGKFKEDPSKAENGTDTNPNVVIANNMQIVSVEGNEYPYQLAEKTDSPAEVKVNQGETSAAVADAVAAADHAAAMAAAASAEANLEDAAVEQVKQIIEESQSVTDESKNIVIVPALEVKAEKYRVDGDNTTMTLDIEASYTSYETDKSITTAAEVKTNAGDTEKVKEIGSGKLNTEGTAVDVKVAVADDFAAAMGATITTPATIYVRHSHSGKNYEYTASLAYDGGVSRYFVSFTNPNGFSPFTLSKTSSAVASIGGKSYTDLQSAIDDAEDGAVITLTNDDDQSAQINSAKTVTIDKDGHTGTVSITAAAGLNLTETDKGGDKTEYTAGRRSRIGGGSSSDKAYTPEIKAALNGTVSLSSNSPKEGEKVTITPKPNDGYAVGAVTVTDENGNPVKVSDNGDGTYTFTQPAGNVKIDVSFKLKQDDASTTEELFKPYTDLDANEWYADGVRYVLENGIMSGVGNGKFAPKAAMTRAQIAQIIYNLEGKPAYSGAPEFADVLSEAWYTDAIAYALANGVMKGYGNGCFGPDDKVTREQLVTILYRYAKLKGVDVSIGENTNILSYDDAFDVSSWAISAMQWACGSGVVTSKTASTLNPADSATRAEIATIIMRYESGIA